MPSNAINMSKQAQRERLEAAIRYGYECIAKSRESIKLDEADIADLSRQLKALDD